MNKNVIIAVVISVIITIILMNKIEKPKEEEVIISSPFYNPYPYYGHPYYYYPRYYRGYGGRRRHREHGRR